MDYRNYDYAVHLLIRYSDNNAPTSGTIAEHTIIIKKYHYVWLGKFGRNISVILRNKIRGQIKEGRETYLFLVGNKKSEHIHIANILDIAPSIDNEEIQRVPAYYRNQTNLVGAWIKLGRIWQAKKSVLEKVSSSFGTPISQTIGSSMSGHLIARTQPNFSPKKVGAIEA